MNKKITIQNCPACEPVNRLMEELTSEGFTILESRLEDYHFHQLYFKVNAKISNIKHLGRIGFTRKDNFLVCDCHWTSVEFKDEDLI